MKHVLIFMAVSCGLLIFAEQASGIDQRSTALQFQQEVVTNPVEDNLVRRYKTDILLNHIKKLAQSNETGINSDRLLESFRQIRRQVTKKDTQSK